MKSALMMCALAVTSFAAEPILVRVTPETLARLQEKDPMIRLVQAKDGEDKVTRPAAPSLIGESTILHDGKNWTLVPNGAVVFLPRSEQSRVNTKPVGTLLPWSVFLRKNASWLATADVSFDQAAGIEEVPAGLAAAWRKHGKIVVATHCDGPISVRVAAATAQASAR